MMKNKLEETEPTVYGFNKCEVNMLVPYGIKLCYATGHTPKRKPVLLLMEAGQNYLETSSEFLGLNIHRDVSYITEPFVVLLTDEDIDIRRAMEGCIVNHIYRMGRCARFISCRSFNDVSELNMISHEHLIGIIVKYSDREKLLNTLNSLSSIETLFDVQVYANHQVPKDSEVSIIDTFNKSIFRVIYMTSNKVDEPKWRTVGKCE